MSNDHHQFAAAGQDASLEPVVLPEPTPEPAKPKKQFFLARWGDNMRQGFQSLMPDWVLKHSTRINQLGLMLGTIVIMGSVWRGKAIGKDLWKAQEDILKGAPNSMINESLRQTKDALVQGKLGLSGDTLAQKIRDLVKDKVMKKPSLHMQRMIYLSTAVTGLGIGGFIKDKETPQEQKTYDTSWRKLPNYIGMRLKHALNPLKHSRQTAGVVGAISGVLAIISAFSQPGGVMISEAFVGGTLISGFSCLALINDPGKAKGWLNFCWASRLLFVISGTWEALKSNPIFPHPLAADLMKTAEGKAGLADAAKNGFQVARFGLSFSPNFGIIEKWKGTLVGWKTLTGDKAEKAFAKKFTTMKLDYPRNDKSYPIGQWFNMAMTVFGLLTVGSEVMKKREQKKLAQKVPDDVERPASLPTPANDLDSFKPATTIRQAHGHSATRLAAASPAASLQA